MRVENDTDEPHALATRFDDLGHAGRQFEPIHSTPEDNVFGYHPRGDTAGDSSPAPDTRSVRQHDQGRLLLFKVTTQSLYNRPLELTIEARRRRGRR